MIYKNEKWTSNMYSFLIESKARLTESKVVESRIKGEDEYDFYTYKGVPLEVEFRGHPITISKGMEFGVRPSSNGKSIRLVLMKPDGEPDLTRVITVDAKTANALANGIKGR